MPGDGGRRLKNQAVGLAGTHPARAYQDSDCLWGVNEPAIDWTATLAHVLTYFVRD